MGRSVAMLAGFLGLAWGTPARATATESYVLTLQYSAPSYLPVNQGDVFTYSCSYSNASPTPLVVAAGTYPPCVAVGLYFPAGMAPCN